jgi:Flp pilus assembly protein TadD
LVFTVLRIARTSLLCLLIIVVGLLLTYDFAIADPRGPTETIQSLRVAIFLHPNNALVHNNLGVVLANAGQWSEALRQFQTAVWIEPDEPSYALNLAAAQFSCENISTARSIYAGLLKEDQDNVDALLGLAGIDRALGCHHDALHQYQLAESIDPLNFDVHTSLGGELMATKQYAAAVYEYETCLCFEPDDAQTLAFLATAQAGLGDVSDAMTTVQSALSLPTITVDMQSKLDVQLGSLFLLQGRAPDAVAALRAALQLTPGDANIHNALGAALYAEGDRRSATSEWQTAYCSNDPEAKRTAKDWLSSP